MFKLYYLGRQFKATFIQKEPNKKGTWRISYLAHKTFHPRYIQFNLAQKLDFLPRGMDIHYYSVKIEALPRLFVFLFWVLSFVFYTIIVKFSRARYLFFLIFYNLTDINYVTPRGPSCKILPKSHSSILSSG